MLKAPVRLGQAALELLFPSSCFGCGRHDGFLCQTCEKSLATLELPYCKTCAEPLFAGSRCRQCSKTRLALDGIRGPFLMEGAIREAIHGLKYGNLKAAAPVLGGLLGRWLASNRVPGEVIVPVPLHRRRLRDRGYNQSALLAREVARIAGLPMAQDVLVRTRDSLPQVSLSTREERVRNVEGSFLCVGNALGKRFILVDDVVTTGSTMSACARALRDAGARSVWGLTLARQRHGGQ